MSILSRLDRLHEAETIVRFDRSGDLAFLWTADRRVARQWQLIGFPVSNTGHGWQAEVPPACVQFTAAKPTRKQARSDAEPSAVGAVRVLAVEPQ